MNIEKELLVAAISKIRPFIKKQSFVNPFSYVYFLEDYIGACNGNQIIKVPFETGVKATVQSDVLFKTLNILPDSFIIRKTQEEIVFSANQYTAKLVQGPELSLIDDTVSGDKFSGEKSVFEINNEDLEEWENSLLIKGTPKFGVVIQKDGDSYYHFNTDSITLIRVRSNALPVEINIPHLFYEQIISLSKEYPVTHVEVFKESIKAVIGDIELYSQLEDNTLNLPNFNNITAKFMSESVVTPITKELYYILKRMASSKVDNASVQASGKDLVFKIESDQISYQETFTSGKDVGAFDVTFNPVLLNKVIGHADHFGVCEEGLILSAKNNDFVFLLARKY
jgi:hypothetical protein